MSAKLSHDDKVWLLNCLPRQRKLNDLEEALVFATFDTETDVDITEIIKTIKTNKKVVRLCFVKLMLFIPEYLMSLVLFNKKERDTLVSCSKIYYKFIRGKLSINEFNKSLRAATKDSIII